MGRGERGGKLGFLSGTSTSIPVPPGTREKVQDPGCAP